ncbi:MAG: hypothetical protein ACK4UN_14880, partial [Limisphaerales bacterium]
MDFFTRQDISRRNSKRLVLYFGLGVISTIIAVYFVALLVFGFMGERQQVRGRIHERGRQRGL